MKRASKLRWFCATVAPWALAAGLLVSFTAVASNDAKLGFSAGPVYREAVTPDGPFIAASGRFARSTLVPDSPPGSLSLAGSVPPRFRLKAEAPDPYPVAARAAKGDALVAITSLSLRGLELAKSHPSVARRLAFARDTAVLPPTVLMRGPTTGPDWTASRSLEPWSGEDPTTTRSANSVQSPAAAAAGSTGAARGPSRLSGDGSTPRAARAVALSSTTPAPADAVPAEIAAAPVSIPVRFAAMPVSVPVRFAALPVIRLDPDRQRYADLITPENLDREQRCLAEAVYFEARSEPEEGQAAVAQVVLNRVRSGLYPQSVCGVVYQNRNRHLACQFTFACEGKALRVTEPDAWDTAKRVALDVAEGRTYLSDVGDATHYHAGYVRPYWARRLKKMDVIGRHIFYELRPGQT